MRVVVRVGSGVLVRSKVADGSGVLVMVSVLVGEGVKVGVKVRVGEAVNVAVGGSPETVKRPDRCQVSPINNRTSYSPGSHSSASGSQSV